MMHRSVKPILLVLLCDSWQLTLLSTSNRKILLPCGVLVAAADPLAAVARRSYKDAASDNTKHHHNQRQRQQQQQRRRQIHDHDTAYYNGEEPPCRDTHVEECVAWAHAGGCDQDRLWMHPHCPVACGVCDQLVKRVSRDEYSLEPPTILGAHSSIVDAVGARLGVPQQLVEGYATSIAERVEEAIEYLEYTVQVEDRYQPVRETCRTYDMKCAYWATLGECDTNQDFMNEQCAPVCFTCEQLHMLSRCPIDPNEKSGMLLLLLLLYVVFVGCL